MHTGIMHTASELLGELDKNLPPKTWRQIMQVFVPTHIADSLQIQQYVGLERENSGGSWTGYKIPPLGYRLSSTNWIIRSSDRGCAANDRASIFWAGQARCCSMNSDTRMFHPCHLNTDLAISHALALLDIHHAAPRAHIPIHTDCTI